MVGFHYRETLLMHSGSECAIFKTFRGSFKGQNNLGWPVVRFLDAWIKEESNLREILRQLDPKSEKTISGSHSLFISNTLISNYTIIKNEDYFLSNL